jgi:hypothetical protein
MGTPNERTVPAALRKQAAAARKRALATKLRQLDDPTGGWWEDREAAALDHEAEALLTPPSPLPLVRGGGEAICPHPLGHDEGRDLPWLADTLETPGIVAAEASLERLRLLADVGCVELACDTAESVRPQNSLERMLTHQLAAAHVAAMRFLAKSTTRLGPPTVSPQTDFIETCRLANTAARLMATFQEGVQTLAKLRTGGKQTVVVQHQHVYVHDGGQAVVAGDLTTGGPSAVGGVCENGGTIPCATTSTAPKRPRAVARKRGKGRLAKAPRAAANGAVGSMEAPIPEVPEATSTP